MRSRAITAVLAVATALLVSVGWGMAPAQAATGPNTFDGSCRLSGEFHFDEPLGNEPRYTAFTDTAVGTCSGTLNGVPGDAIPVVNSVSGSATLSCLAGQTSTADTLTFAHRFKIHIFVDAAFGLTQAVGNFRGAVSGGGVVEVNFLPYFDQSTQAACQTGTLSSARYDLIAHTITTLVG
jgi:hypothetical protein